jgi:hypothetical protein
MQNWKHEQHIQGQPAFLATDKMRSVVATTAHERGTPTRPLLANTLREALAETQDNAF